MTNRDQRHHSAAVFTNRLAEDRPVGRLILLLLLLGLCPYGLFAQEGTVRGHLVDPTGAAIVTAQIRLSFAGENNPHETLSGPLGDFSFQGLRPGQFQLSFTAAGFAPKTTTGELHTGENLQLPPIELPLSTVSTSVSVTQTQEEIAEGQVKQAESQRLVGLVPNFFINYNSDAAPLNTRQKFQLTWKTLIDPSAFVINGVIAATWQAQNTYPGFGQGAQGYAKRYGASYADFATSLVLEKVALTTTFRQDPRYFYKGTGSRGSRLRYALSRSVICQGDNRQPQFCYSSVLSGIASGFITNYYYPEHDRNSNGVVLQNAAIGIGIDAVVNVFQEFFFRSITREKH